MWNYEKRLQFPINIKNTNAALAKIIISQYGGPNSKKIYKKHLRHIKNEIFPFIMMY